MIKAKNKFSHGITRKHTETQKKNRRGSVLCYLSVCFRVIPWIVVLRLSSLSWRLGGSVYPPA